MSVLKFDRFPHATSRMTRETSEFRWDLAGSGPTSRARSIFTDSEWRALTTFVNQTGTPPATPPSLNEAVGQLGGHLGRAHDGEPGSEALWRGMTRLADIEMAYDLYH